MCVSVCDRCALLSAWRAKESGNESPRGNAWETHFQNLDIKEHTHTRGKTHETISQQQLLDDIAVRFIEEPKHLTSQLVLAASVIIGNH